ncbi:MAG: hypothetical protein K2J90_02235 [Lachnospiraceae bacterium]|nr:hypothetical protein [Lachnospiraceae bacterium]
MRRSKTTGADSIYFVSDTRRGLYLYDGHGDVRALLSEKGKITDKYRY